MASQNIFLNAVSVKMIHENETSEGKKFANVTIPYADSKTGLASFGVNLGQVMQATRKDGTEIEGMKNILLGKPEGTRQVSVCVKQTKAGKRTYENVTLTNAAIAEAFNAARAEYKASLAQA